MSRALAPSVASSAETFSRSRMYCTSLADVAGAGGAVRDASALFGVAVFTGTVAAAGEVTAAAAGGVTVAAGGVTVAGGQAPLGVVVTPAMAVLPAPPVVAVARQRFQARAAPEISIRQPHYGSTGPVQLETPVLGSSARPAPRRRTSRLARRCS